MKNTLWMILMCLLVQTIEAQDLGSSSRFIADKVWTVALDPLQQIYYINDARQLVKLSNIYEKEYVYSDLMIDAYTQIISQNPFKIILFKKDIGDIIILDNRLNVTVKTNLFDLGYFSVSSLTISNDNSSLWIFDEERQQLVKLDQQYKSQFQSHQLSQQISKKIKAHQIIESENKIYLLDRHLGVFLFDNVGNYSKSYPILNAERLWVISNKIYFFRDQQLWTYDPLLFEEIALYDLGEFQHIELCRDFVMGINAQKELYQLPWKK